MHTKGERQSFEKAFYTNITLRVHSQAFWADSGSISERAIDRSQYVVYRTFSTACDIFSAHHGELEGLQAP